MRRFFAKITSEEEYHGAIFFPAHIALPGTGGSGPVDFLLDTGSASTILGENYLIKLGLEIHSLPRASMPISGWCGQTEAHVVPGACVFLRDANGQSEMFELPQVICGRNPRDGKEKKGRVRIRSISIPSVLGRDFLETHDLVAHIDLRDKYVFPNTKA